MRRYLFVALFLSAVCAVNHNCQQDESIVDTQNGCVSGVVDDSVRRFLGIPFAEPPIGNLRWADPVAISDWYPKVFQADSDSPACPQSCALPPGLCPTETAEDCLYLDVITPRTYASQTSWPVMVFIAGGAYEQSSPFVPLYDADFIANYTNTVVVLIAYRLGALGFLVTDELNGNYGIKDQRLALQWVNNNIANFGGDVTSITIFGESAGAGSVGVHLMSSKSSNLFDKAIMESNPLALPFKPNSEAATYGAKLAKDLGCDTDDLNCLRNVSVESIVGVQDNIFVIPDPLRTNLLDIVLSWAPTIDGDEVQGQPITAFQQGDYDQSKPILIGTNSNEAVMFIYGFLSPLIGNGSMASWEYDLLLAAIYDLSADDVHSLYPPSSQDARISLSTLMTDYLFVCSSRNVAASISQHGTVFEYNFNHSLSFDAWGPDFQFCDPYACHGAELPFVFHTPLANFDQDEEQLSVDMVTYWANFARNGDPSVGMPVNLKWPAYNPTSNSNMEFATPTSLVQTDYRKKYCDFWDSLGYDF